MRRALPGLWCALSLPQVLSLAAAGPVDGGATLARVQSTKVFSEPLVALGTEPSADENTNLFQALSQFRNNQKVGAFDAFLHQFPHSPWRASLLVNLGNFARESGQLSHCLAFWRGAWESSKDLTGSTAKAVADEAAGNEAELMALLGQKREATAFLKEVGARSQTMVGPSASKILTARGLLDQMTSDPQHTLLCGPSALAALHRDMCPDQRLDLSIWTIPVGPKGTSLAENWHTPISQELGLQMAKREKGETWPVPSMVHWKLGHYSAVLRERAGQVLVKDALFGGERWIQQAVLDAEASGYALIPKGPLPKGWRAVHELEAQQVWAGSCGSYTDPHALPPKKPTTCPVGMPVASLNVYSAAVMIDDAPVGYTPPRGPSVSFLVSYNSKNVDQPATFTYANLGPKWGFTWLATLTDDPTTVGSSVTLYPSQGGIQVQPSTGYNSSTQTYAPDYYTQDQVVRTSSTSYKVLHPDGSVEIYGLTDGAAVAPRRFFRTQAIDPAGNTLTYAYDAQFRLVSVADALGQVTTLSYSLTSDPLKITQVQDPFGRTATLTYANGLLASITDAAGLTSVFAYGPTTQFPTAAADFINAMTTPYGTTTFKGMNGSTNTWIVSTDPMGNQERAEYLNYCAALPTSDPAAPSGVINSGLNYYSSYFWDKRAMALAPGDYTQAHAYKWIYEAGTSLASILASEKKPLDHRTWYLYAGQSNAIEMGTTATPSSELKILDDGTTQSRLRQLNALGRTTQETDPAGRITSYVYAGNGIDLLEVHNITGATDDLLAKYTYNAQHRPLTATDASGQTTTFTYNTFGQVHTVTNAKNETTTLTYDTNGYLQNIQGPVTGALTTFTYDSVGRIYSVTNPDNYTLSYGYDNLDRRTQITYPDASTEQTIYSLLDVGRTKDRLNRWTLMTYNPIRQLTDVQDPQGRLTHLNWCGCGTLESLVDPMGRITTWARDLEGRVVAKIYPDLTQTSYAYDSAGRLTQRTDAKGQVTNYGYFIDDDLRSVAYSNAAVATPSTSYTYEIRYNRLATSTGGTGTTTYAYNPVTTMPALGATRLLSVTSPMANSAITYGYDPLGRVLSRSINGVAENRTYDALGRIATVTNPLGAFTYTYDGATNRLLNVAYPNGQTTAFTYFNTLGDKRLQSIQNLKSTGANISTFGYTYDATGQIQSWSQQADAQSPKAYGFSYDPVGQLLSATLTDTGTSQVLKTYVYGYDDAGNRTAEQINGAITTSTYNTLNQLAGQSFSATPSLAGPQGGEALAASPKTSPSKPRRRLAPKKPLQPLARN
ncbi:MAG TPA: hypothetical protein VNV60_02450 [Holophagaceae bacterium]|jgi:YD repeat-containing protein|nr:hypothetical protein [Holophagaceae bacterium]